MAESLAGDRARPPRPMSRPAGIVDLWIDPETGLLVRGSKRRARAEIFRRGAEPRRDRFWRTDEAVPVIY